MPWAIKRAAAPCRALSTPSSAARTPHRRPGRTVAYIGAEFWDTVKRTNFVIAVRVESEGPMQELHPGDQTWYISEDGITLEKAALP